MDPGTAAIAVLSTITGVAGYGAMKLNSNQALAADMRANQLAAEKIEKVRRELTLATEDMKRKAEQELKAKQAEVDAFKRDLNSLKQSKAVLEGKLQEASEGERLFASVPLPEFKKAMGILKESPEIQTAVDPSKTKAVEKVFANYTSTSRLRISRGSLHSLYQDLQTAMGKPFLERDAFNTMVTNILRTVQPDVVPEPVPEPPAPEPPAPEPAPKPAPEPPAPEPQAAPPPPGQPDIQDCKSFLRENGINTEDKAALRSQVRAWAKINHPDKWQSRNEGQPAPPEITARFQRMADCSRDVYGARVIGGLRKKKLRTRRGGKQRNVRRTRRSEDSADRTDSHSG